MGGAGVEAVDWVEGGFERGVREGEMVGRGLDGRGGWAGGWRVLLFWWQRGVEWRGVW